MKLFHYTNSSMSNLEILNEGCQRTNISCLNVNIRSLSAHFVELEAFLLCNQLKPTIIGFTETWLEEERQAKLYKLPGYHNLIPCNRSWGTRGGVGLMLDKKLKYRVLLKDTTHEWLVVEVVSPINFIIMVTYRCENRFSRKVYCEWLLEELSRLNKTNKHVIVLGDFNIDLLTKNNQSQELIDIMKSFNLQLSSPLAVTREYGNSKTCLDHTYSDIKVSSSRVYQCTITDHFFVFVQFQKPLKTEKVKSTFRNFNFLLKNDNLCKYNFVLLNEVNKIDWDSLSMDNCFDELRALILKIADVYAPMKTVFFRQNNWVDNKLKRELNKRDYLYKLWIKDRRNADNREKYRRQRNLTKTLTRDKKKQYVQEQFGDGSDIKRFHKQLNSIIGKTSDSVFPNINSLSDLDNFNDYFTEVGPSLQKTIPPEPTIPTNKKQLQSMFLKPITETEVEKILLSFKSKVSTGPDNTSAKLIKLSFFAIVPTITKLINRCIHEGYFPSCLKIARVMPLYKDGDANVFENYRPISLLHPLAKIFERALYNRMVSYIKKFNLLSPNQFGFREKFKTVDALACLVEQIRVCLDEKIPSTCVFIDLKKAFDTIDHEILLSKLDDYGFRGPIFSVIRSFLSNRKQFVQIGNEKSSLKDILCGVPQGSVLGPLLFILYVNDLPSFVNSDVKLFADDTTIFERIPSFDLNLITRSINLVDTWMKGNKLKCNVDKSKAVIFAKNAPVLSFGNLNITIQSHLKYLGIEIDDSLTFKDHVHKIKSKLLFCNYIVLRTRTLLTRTQLFAYYRTHVKPIVQYGVLVYACTAYSNLSDIFKVQKRIIRSICFLPKYGSVSDIMSQNELPTVYELHVYELLKFVLCCIRQEHSHDFLNSILSEIDIKYCLRSVSRHQSAVPFGSRKKFNHSLAKRVPKFYNKLTQIGILPEKSTIQSFSLHQMKQYSHNTFKSFILGNTELIDFVFEQVK